MTFSEGRTASAKSPSVKIIDYGACIRIREASTAGSGGDLDYAAPEVVGWEGPHARSDVFSLGLTLLECAFGYLPDGRKTDFNEGALKSVRDFHCAPANRPESPQTMEFKRLIEKMLPCRYDERPTMADIVRELSHLETVSTVAQGSSLYGLPQRPLVVGGYDANGMRAMPPAPGPSNEIGSSPLPSRRRWIRNGRRVSVATDSDARSVCAIRVAMTAMKARPPSVSTRSARALSSALRTWISTTRPGSGPARVIRRLGFASQAAILTSRNG